jgi:flagellar hook-associated protein 1 FlgK
VGFARQRAALAEADAVFNGSYMVGTGVTLEQVTSLRDRILELRIQDEKQQQGSTEAQVHALEDIQTLFATTTETIGDSIDKFFNSLSALSVDASSVPLRQSVLMSATNLTNSFHTAVTTLQQRQFSLDLDIEQAVQEVNQITGEIAKLNQQIARSGAGSSETGSFEDHRILLLQNLSSLIGNHVIVADDGLSVTLTDGTPLVVGDKATPLSVARQANAEVRVLTEGSDITDNIEGGKLHGILNIRQEVIPTLIQDLDALAAGISNSCNTIHRGGIDLDGNANSDLFSPVPAGSVGAAASCALNILNPRQLAAGADGTAGDNAVVNELLGLREQGIINGDRPTAFYAKIAFGVGSKLANAKAELNASEMVAEQLAQQRGAISAVSLDEEAADLIRYQRAFEAAARVISVLSDLTDTAVNIGRS